MILSLLSKVLPFGIKTGMEIVKNRQQTKRLESLAAMRHMEKMSTGELEYKQAVIKDQNQGWKDEFVLILCSAPIVLLIWGVFSDDPMIQQKIDDFFAQFANLPYWYQALFIGIVASIYGLKGADIFKKK
jgi:uncharacterized ion transporter superfamily protein YfcC